MGDMMRAYVPQHTMVYLQGSPSYEATLWEIKILAVKEGWSLVKDKLHTFINSLFSKSVAAYKGWPLLKVAIFMRTSV